jgi:hypothetical protein
MLLQEQPLVVAVACPSVVVVVVAVAVQTTKIQWKCPQVFAVALVESCCYKIAASIEQ